MGKTAESTHLADATAISLATAKGAIGWEDEHRDLSPPMNCLPMPATQSTERPRRRWTERRICNGREACAVAVAHPEEPLRRHLLVDQPVPVLPRNTTLAFLPPFSDHLA
jgi:hypothetical protein